MPSGNTTVITESPKREMERISVTPGTVRSCNSSGTVMSCSTSWAASAGLWVMTCTWLLVTSGMASSGRLAAEKPPQATSPATSRATSSLLRTLAAMIFSSISC